MRILIVDDNANSSRVIALMLKPYGSCVTASCGQEALDLYEQSVADNARFDLIYLDLMMPDMGGLEVLSTLRRLEAERDDDNPVPVVMLTGEADTFQINQAQSLGVVEYLLKPVREERLVKGLAWLGFIKGPETV